MNEWLLIAAFAIFIGGLLWIAADAIRHAHKDRTSGKHL
jgi:hypothetical protein